MKLTPEQKQEWIEAALAFVEGEPIQYRACNGKWWDTDSMTRGHPYRRKFKPKPDPLEEFKAARKAGKRVEYNINASWFGRAPEWVPVTASQKFALPPEAYRIVATPRMVPLEADDLICCVLRPPGATAGWIAPSVAFGGFVHIPPCGLYERTIPFAKLQTDGWTYHRTEDRGNPLWHRCEKEAK